MKESHVLPSIHLQRNVNIDIYLEQKVDKGCSLLLINDGQDLVTMNFEGLINGLQSVDKIRPLVCIGIHCGEDRRNEYGMKVSPDYKGRGTKGALYHQFILEELLPMIKSRFPGIAFEETAYAGFSLGGLSALDISWNNPEIFSRAGIFSGSFWWRSKSPSAPDYNEWNDRLMHRQLKSGKFKPGMKFFFECGELDETEDRNRNGVIDSIDDTLDIIRILVNKGYREGPDIKYLQLPGGRHDVDTWSKAFPNFLLWSWGK